MHKTNNNLPLVSHALCLAFALTAAVLLAACAPTLVKTETAPKPARTVLILTGAGMVPASVSEPRYEQTWLQVVAKYAAGLSEAMNAAGLYAQVHIRKDRNESIESTFTRLLAEDRKDALLQVTVRHVRNSTENTVYLNAQFMPLDFRYYSNGQRRVVPQAAGERDYPVLSTTGPDLRKASIPDLGKQFIQDMRAQGHLQ